MATKSTSPVKTASSALNIRRMINAPRSQVWKALTDPGYIKQWWGPKDFTAPIAKNNLRVGGKYLFCMRSPDGKDYYSTGIYEEITAPTRLVYTDNFADAGGNIVPPSYYGMNGDWGQEGQVTIILEEPELGKTMITLEHTGIPEEEKQNAMEGWNQSLDKLDYALQF